MYCAPGGLSGTVRSTSTAPLTVPTDRIVLATISLIGPGRAFSCGRVTLKRLI